MTHEKRNPKGVDLQFAQDGAKRNPGSGGKKKPSPVGTARFHPGCLCRQSLDKSGLNRHYASNLAASLAKYVSVIEAPARWIQSSDSIITRS